MRATLALNGLILHCSFHDKENFSIFLVPEIKFKIPWISHFPSFFSIVHFPETSDLREPLVVCFETLKN